MYRYDELKFSDFRNLSATPLRHPNSKFERQIYLPTASYFNNNTEKPNKVTQNEDEKNNIPKLIRSFLGYTTAHGFSRLEGSKGVLWKVFWALVCLGSFGMFTFQVHGLFELYFSHPVSTNVRITFEKVRSVHRNYFSDITFKKVEVGVQEGGEGMNCPLDLEPCVLRPTKGEGRGDACECVADKTFQWM